MGSSIFLANMEEIERAKAVMNMSENTLLKYVGLFLRTPNTCFVVDPHYNLIAVCGTKLAEMVSFGDSVVSIRYSIPLIVTSRFFFIVLSHKFTVHSTVCGCTLNDLMIILFLPE